MFSTSTCGGKAFTALFTTKALQKREGKRL